MGMLDEVDRSLHDALMVVKRTLESKKVVPGGGSVESACHIHLEAFSSTIGTREQLAIQEFAEALLVIPRTLIVNAAKDAAELVSQLISKHTVAQTVKGKEDLRFLGLDLVEGSVVDNVKRGVLEPALSKVKSLVLLQRLLLRFCESTIISKSIRSKPRMLMDMGIDVTIVFFFCMVSICFNLIHFEHCIEWSKYKRKH